MSARFWTVTGAVLAGLAVALGALAAHGLDEYFKQLYANTPAKMVVGVAIPAPQKYLNDFKTAAEYQMYHALGLLVVGTWSAQWRCRTLNLAGWSFLVGIVLFSGCLYALTLTGQRWLGMIVPLGGVAFLVGWGAMAFAAGRRTWDKSLACQS